MKSTSDISSRPGCGAGNASGRTCGTRREHAVAWILGAVVLAVACHTATTGLFWSEFFHPDETTVARWIDEVRDDGYIHDRAYPSGWFELMRVEFWLERKTGKLRRHWTRHAVQDGAVRAVLANTFVRAPDGGGEEDEREHSIQDGRNFNAFLYVASALLFFGAALETGMRPSAAFVSAAFFLADAGPIEFLHYCETDEALIFSLALFAWIAARAARLKSPWLALCGCLAAGFAVSCKFTLAPVLLWCLAAPFATLARRAHGRRAMAWGIPAMILFGGAAAYAGYAIGTPALRLAPEWYFKALREARELTYAEILENLGGNYSWRGACAIRLASLHAAMSSYGWAALAWGLFSWSFWLRRDFRGQFPGAPALLPLFFPFLVTLCPFVRSQEALPVTMLLALGAGLPLEWWLRHRAELKGTGHRLAATASAAFCTAALASCATGATSMSDCFRRRDSRAEAQNWLRRTLPARKDVSFDNYVGQVARGVDCTPYHLYGLPFRWHGVPADPETSAPLPYYVENVGFEGRIPIRDPRTGRIRKDVREKVADYEKSILPVKIWSVARGARRPTFGQPIVRMSTFDKPGDDAIDIPIGYHRPVLLLPDGVPLYDSYEAAGLGANCAVHTMGRRSQVNFLFDYGQRWIVTEMLDGDQPVVVTREGLSAKRKTPLPPGGAVATQVRPGLLRRILPGASACHTMKCRTRGDDQTVVCASFIARSAADAAREMRIHGDPRGALALLSEARTLDAQGRVEAFLAATQTGDPPEPSWVEAARTALQSCGRAAQRARDGDLRGITLCGTPLSCANDFARVRIHGQTFAPGTRLPLSLPPGNYSVTIKVLPSVAMAGTPLRIPKRLLPGQVSNFAASKPAPGGTVLETRLSLDKCLMLSLPGTPGDDSFPEFSADIEVTWSPLEMTLEQADAIGMALAQQRGSDDLATVPAAVRNL